MKRVLRHLLKGGRYRIRAPQRDGCCLKVFLVDNLKGRDLLPSKRLVRSLIYLPGTRKIKFLERWIRLISVAEVDVGTKLGHTEDNVGDIVIVFGVKEWGAEVPKEEERHRGGVEIDRSNVFNISSWGG